MKNILSILLIVVVVLTMTACGTTTATVEPTTEPTAESTEPATTAESTEPATTAESTEPTTETSPEDKVPSIIYLVYTEEELRNFVDEMVNISANETLSSSDINDLAINFTYILMSNESTELFDYTSNRALEVYRNVLYQKNKNGLLMDDIFAWSAVPVKEVLMDFYTHYDYEIPYIVSCYCLDYLTEADAVEVVKVIFSNFRLEKNHYLIFDVIECSYPEVKSLGIARLKQISESTSYFDFDTTYSICSLFSHACSNDISESEKKLICQNILTNKYYDFVAKYQVLCNSADESVATQASERLLAIAEDANAQTATLIKEVAENLWSVDLSQQLLDVLEG